MESLVSTQWLADHLGEAGLVVLDASAHLPAAKRNAGAEFLAAHIPTAAFLDLETWIDPDSAVPAAIPNAMQFGIRTSGLGIAPTDRVVVYDDSDVKTSARAWFIFRHFRFEHVAILDGGLEKWRREGRPLENGKATSVLPHFLPPPSDAREDVRSKLDLLTNLGLQHEQVVDARGRARFTGEEPDFRPNIASGHIPGSGNLPYNLLFAHDGTFCSPKDLRRAFEKAGVDLDRPVVTTCGGGVTAAVLLFALHLLGKDDVALYDGSWSEWGADPATPKELGAIA